MIQYLANLFSAIIGRKTVQKDKEKPNTSHASISDYQKLVENLRERLSTAEANYRAEMADLHACYKEQVRCLQDKLQQANATIGQETRSKAMLEQTNNALSDLCSAMAGDSIDEIIYVTQRLEWSNPLTRIAQYYINVIKRKAELEKMATENLAKRS